MRVPGSCACPHPFTRRSSEGGLSEIKTQVFSFPGPLLSTRSRPLLDIEMRDAQRWEQGRMQSVQIS